MARRSKLLIFGLPLLALCAAVGATYSISRSQPQSFELQPRVSPPVQPGIGVQGGAADHAGYIGAAGLIEPNGQEIDIGAHVSGIIEKVLVEPGQKVKRGDPLFVQDERAARGTVDLRRAELVSAERRRDQTVARAAALKAQIEASRASAAAAAADLDEATDLARVGNDLLARGANAISQREVTKRRNGERTASGRLEEARARITQMEEELRLISPPDGASLAVDEANVVQARRSLERAEVDLDLLTVRAPIGGTVLQVNVRSGEFAFAGNILTPMIVMGNLEPLHVRVDIDEAEIGRFSPTARAYASPRGQPDRRIELSFVGIDPLVVPKRSLTGAAGERVDTRVLKVVYALPKGTPEAYSGQQVDVYIETSPAATAQVNQTGSIGRRRK